MLCLCLRYSALLLEIYNYPEFSSKFVLIFLNTNVGDKWKINIMCRGKVRGIVPPRAFRKAKFSKLYSFKAYCFEIAHWCWNGVRSAPCKGHGIWFTSISYSSKQFSELLWMWVESSQETTPTRIEMFWHRIKTISQKYFVFICSNLPL